MKLLVVDDHELFREGLRALLHQTAPEHEILVACDATEGLQLANRHPEIDIAFVDLDMPGGGMRMIEALGKAHPQIPVIVISMSENPRDVRRAIAIGALGYVPKTSGSKTLLGAMNMVLQGDVYIPPLMLNHPRSSEDDLAPKGAPDVGVTTLTNRQIDVLRLIVEGCSNREISMKLGLSEKTVKVHVSAIFKELNVVNRTQAASIAQKAKII